MIKVKCNWCNNILYRNLYWKNRNKNNFCDNKCYGKWRSKNIINSRHPNFKEKIKTRCSYCKKVLNLPTWKYNRSKEHFCNELCMGKYYSKYLIGKKHPCYIHGQSKQSYILSFNKKLKDEIRKRDGYKCNLCGLTQVEHLIKYREKLHPHHIDYDKSHADPKRLITLCRICNSKVNKHRDYWFAYFSYIIDMIYNIL